MFNTSWNVDRYRNKHESDEHWGLRRQFMVAHKDKYPEDRLVCLTQVFFNMEFLGCRYPYKTMELVNSLTKEVAEEFRESRKGRLKRTFVGAQDAAGAKAKGEKPPPGSLDGSGNKQQLDVSQEPESKKLRKDEDKAEDLSEVVTIDDEDDDDSNKDEEVAGAPTPDSRDLTADLKEIAKTFILMIPPRTNSKTEENHRNIIHLNFPGNRLSLKFEGSKAEGGWTCEMFVAATNDAKQKPNLCMSSVFATTQRAGKQQAARNAVANLMKYCSYIEPNPAWFKDGRTPDFIEKRIPCNKYPRTYIIMTKKDTGYITPQVADMLMENFHRSSNEDMFFLDTEYNKTEKETLLSRSNYYKLGFRHFGPQKLMSGHHLCVSKIKTAEEIVEEARKLGWNHPKYIVHLKKP